MKPTIFVTATDTGVGKTLLTALLAGFLQGQGTRVAALKPICSGGRGDARQLRAALENALPLDEINPWHFRAPIAPLLAARREHRQVTLTPVLAHIRAVRRNFDLTLVEGAGGLLSPLGAGFDSRDLLLALDAIPVLVAPDQLGVVNHILLTLEALPARFRRRTTVVLMAPPRADSAAASNAELLHRLAVRNVCRLPWLGKNPSPPALLRTLKVRQSLAAIVHSWLPAAGRRDCRGRIGR
jgi:dethiobiotin synthetase